MSKSIQNDPTLSHGPLGALGALAASWEPPGASWEPLGPPGNSKDSVWSLALGPYVHIYKVYIHVYNRGGIDCGRDTPKRLYKAPTDQTKPNKNYTKPQKQYTNTKNIRQHPKILDKYQKYLARVATHISST